jgi:hypothetical protein
MMWFRRGMDWQQVIKIVTPRWVGLKEFLARRRSDLKVA